MYLECTSNFAFEFLRYAYFWTEENLHIVLKERAQIFSHCSNRCDRETNTHGVVSSLSSGTVILNFLVHPRSVFFFKFQQGIFVQRTKIQLQSTTLRFRISGRYKRFSVTRLLELPFASHFTNFPSRLDY